LIADDFPPRLRKVNPQNRHQGPLSDTSLPENLRNRAFEPVTELLKGVQRDVLLPQFKPVEGGVGEPSFSCKLLIRKVSAPLSEERSELICHSFLSHDRILGLPASRIWDIFALRGAGRGLKFTPQIHRNDLAEGERAKMKTITTVSLTLVLLVCMTPSVVQAQSKYTNINIEAMKGVIQQDAGLSAVSSNLITQINLYTDAGFDLFVSATRQYVTEAGKISLDTCPDQFAKAYKIHLATWWNLADTSSSHPHFPSKLESVFGPSSAPDQEGFNAWKQRYDSKTMDVQKSWDQVMSVFNSYRLGEQPPNLMSFNEFAASTNNLMVTNLSCECHDGFFSDSVYLTNNSGQDLTRVRVAIFVTGKSGGRRRVPGEYYWSTWASGEKKSVSIAGDESVVSIKFADLLGNCDQGTFGPGSVSH